MAPSIPMPGQNYGYDEDVDGILKPQKLPAQDSTIGPAYYNVIHVGYRYAYYDMLVMLMKYNIIVKGRIWIIKYNYKVLCALRDEIVSCFFN